MKKSLFIALLFSTLFVYSCNHKANEPGIVDTAAISFDTSYNIDIKDFKMRDPFVFVDTIGKSYYIHANSGDNQTLTVYQSKDLKTTVEAPILLFRASSAPWVGDITAKGVTGKVTDAPFIYRMSGAELVMIWSSFSKTTKKYAIGVAHSSSGSITGPWVQEPTAINNDDGGHAMVFRNLDGQLKISYHSPNTYPNFVSINNFTTNN
ncbi:MAG: family 43 glycosylhydrolase [Mariniphaga sp.]